MEIYLLQRAAPLSQNPTMNDMMHSRKVAGALDLSAWASESPASNAGKWYTTNVAAELAAYQAATRPVEAFRKQFEALNATQCALATVEQARFADMQVSAVRAAESSVREHIQLHAEVASAEAQWGTLGAAASSDVTLRAYASATSAATGLTAFESAASATAGLEALNSITGAAFKLGTFESIAGAAAKLAF